MMRGPTLALFAAVAGGAAGASVIWSEATRAQPTGAPATELRPASAFSSIADARERSIALFQEAAKVLQHPRCVNCHPRGDRPTQTDRMRPHEPLVVRGADGHGAPALACKTCHGDANYEPARVPGDPHWHLAPLSMAWEGLSVGAICEQLKDPARNGNRTLAGIVDHATNDSLVKWGWNPGGGRTPAPGNNEVFGALLQAWVDTGAQCPAR
jgi:hypothetical protein